MQQNRVVLITGASSGFGRSIASLLTERGFTVFGTSRRLQGSKADGFEMLELNVDSDESVQRCVQNLLQKTGRLDILVNNAGYLLDGAIEETSIQEAKSQFETNFFGTVRMVKAVLPIMRKQGNGQIINMSSLAGTIALPFSGFYSAGKAAILAYSEALRHEVKSFNIKVSTVEPGFFKTNIMNSSKHVSEPIQEYSEMSSRVRSRAIEVTENGADPKLVAETVLRTIENHSPKLHYRVGRESKYVTIKKILPESMFESRVRKFSRLDG